MNQEWPLLVDQAYPRSRHHRRGRPHPEGRAAQPRDRREPHSGGPHYQMPERRDHRTRPAGQAEQRTICARRIGGRKQSGAAIHRRAQIAVPCLCIGAACDQIADCSDVATCGGGVQPRWDSVSIGPGGVCASPAVTMKLISPKTTSIARIDFPSIRMISLRHHPHTCHADQCPANSPSISKSPSTDRAAPSTARRATSPE